MLQNKYLVAKIGFDTAENGPFHFHNFSSLQGFNFHRAVVSPQVGMRRGQLSKAVLPYGETTSTLDQTHEENEPETQVLLDAGITERQIAHLVRDATTLRKLVRVKIADDQDLDQAESAMHELKTFLTGLNSLSQSQRQSEWELLQQMT